MSLTSIGYAETKDSEIHPVEIDDKARGTKKKNNGTFGIAELSDGILINNHAGYEIGLVAGGGGKPPGLPLRLYGIGELALGRSEASPSNHFAKYEESFFDITVGIRAYLPLGSGI